MIVVDPAGMTPTEWCDSVADNLSSLTRQVYKVASDDDWRTFGNFMLESLRRRGAVVPDPQQFAEFEEWAMRFNQVIAPLEA